MRWYIKLTTWLSVYILIALISMVPAYSGQVDYSATVSDWIGEKANSTSRSSDFGKWECDIYTFESGYAYVEKTSGQILNVIYKAKNNNETQQPIDLDMAMKIADEWLVKHFVIMDGWTLIDSYSKDTGTPGINHTFLWGKYQGNIRLPYMMKMSISEKGDVLMWYRIGEPATVDLTPTITPTIAKSKVTELTSLGMDSITEPTLRIWFSGKTQVLFWDVYKVGEKITKRNKLLASINAHTGEVVSFVCDYVHDKLKSLQSSETQQK